MDLIALTQAASGCTHCSDILPLGPRPVFQVSPRARVLVVGQAPGRRVHETGVPFNDPSGDRLREWMGVDRETFYDAEQIALLPMAFCFPGTGTSGDLPPPKACAQLWRERFIAALDSIELTIVCGQYSQAWHLQGRQKKNLTETVRAWREYDEALVPTPHPSPRNNGWLKRNPWFDAELIPELRRRVDAALSRVPPR